ncbi:MAG: alpha/beta hydrolase [Ferruginibacter sp.]
MKRSFGGVVVFLILWVIMAQSCMKFRISDSEAVKKFEKAGVTLTTASVKVGGANIHYAKTGNDSFPTIVFIHGSPGSWDAFSGYMQDKDLLQKYRMISIDRPGFGYSNFGDAQHIEDQSAMISPLFDLWKNGKPVYLVGHSLGGPMVIQLNADNPGLFSGLVLLAGSVDPAEEKKEKWRYILDAGLLRYMVPGAFSPSNKELLYFKKDVYALQDKFALVKCKVIIVHGTQDPLVPVGNATFAQHKLVNANSVKLILIPGANHFIPWTKYDTIKQILWELYE